MNEIHITRTTAWLRIVLWITPGCFALLIVLMGEGVFGKFGIPPGNKFGLQLFAFMSVLITASCCDLLLRRGQTKDFTTNLVLQGLFFVFCQIFITPLVAGVLGFACCMFQLG